MSIVLKMNTYLKELTLPHQKDLVDEILLFLNKEIKLENARGNEETIAKLFCRTIESLEQDEPLDDYLQDAIIDAFDNIKTIENNTHENGELMCIYLLNLIFSGQEDFDQIQEKDFVLLLENLEKIRCIFKICDKDKNLRFPIGNFLFQLINSENLFEEIKKVSSIQALMLALQIFDGSQYSRERKNIEKMIEGKDLRFIEYLFHRCTRVGNDDWKDNYEKNGLLILYDHEDNKVLIRNNSSSYFERHLDLSDYKCGTVCSEKNANKEPIAYFVEYALDDFRWVDLKRELSLENNKSRISQILDIIYYRQNYNVMMESSLFEKSGKIYPINPFGINDLYVVDGGETFKDGKSAVSERLYQYGLLKIDGIGLRYVNLGLLVKLEEINAIPFESFKVNRNSDINDVVENWLKQCGDKQKCFNDFFRDYEEQVKYIFTRNSIFEKKYNKEYLIPSAVSEDIINQLDLDEKFVNYSIEQINISIDLLQDETHIKKTNGDILQEYDLKDIAGEDVIVKEGEVWGLVDDANKTIYVGKQVDYYHLMTNKIKQINENVLTEETLKKVKENDIDKVAEKMMCFKDALKGIHHGIPMESIARYRVLNHLLLLRPTESDVKQWLKIIEKHEIADFSVVVGKSPIDTAQGVLYVPKDRPRTQSTLKYINEKYFINNARRSPVELYDQIITEENGIFYAGGERIKRIVLIFDNIQCGKSTKETIDYYLTTKVENLDEKHMPFYCNGKEISVYDIMQANNCEVEVYSIYAGDIGLAAVKTHVENEYPQYTINVLDPVKRFTAVTRKPDIDIIHKLYPNNMAGGIKKKNYLVVREYNQPKRNIMCDKLLEIDRVTALFCKRGELNT